MKLALDVHYRPAFAKAVSVAFADWQDATPVQVQTARIQTVAEYVPGQFYRRELPCLLEILRQTPHEKIELIIVDGYVQLNETGKPGLGRHLYDALEGRIPIIGVAKKAYHTNAAHVRPVLRGRSQKPLFITSVDYPLDEAAQRITAMPGKYRMPDLLRLLDQTTKQD